MELKENITGKKAIYETLFDIKIEKECLLINFVAKNSTFNSYSNIYNDDIWKGDVCEIFIDVGRKNHYFEIEVAPNNTQFLADIENIDGKFKGSKIYPSFFNSEVIKKDNSYIVNISIPLSKINYNSNYGIKYNAFRIDTDGEISEKYLFALNPTLSNTFHKKEFFIKL